MRCDLDAAHLLAAHGKAGQRALTIQVRVIYRSRAGNREAQLACDRQPGLTQALDMGHVDSCASRVNLKLMRLEIVAASSGDFARLVVYGD